MIVERAEKAAVPGSVICGNVILQVRFLPFPFLLPGHLHKPSLAEPLPCHSLPKHQQSRVPQIQFTGDEIFKITKKVYRAEFAIVWRDMRMEEGRLLLFGFKDGGVFTIYRNTN